MRWLSLSVSKQFENEVQSQNIKKQMKTIYLALAIIALSLFVTSCRSRQASHGHVQGFAPATGTQQPRNVTPPQPQPLVQVSFRQAEEPTVAQQTPTPAVVQPPAPTVTRHAPVGQTNVGVTFIEPPAPVRQTPTQQPMVRQEGVNAVFQADAPSLRRYNVVVASLNNRWNAETLQRRLQNDGHHVILAQNERGMYRVIVGSFDHRFQAVSQLDQLRRRYSALGNPDFLRRTYGIPFNDLWILTRHF